MQFGPSAASAIPKPASWPIWLILALAAAALGFWMHSAGLGYYLSMISRMMIYGLAACSLNLILGYGGLVSFGHAAYLGIGAYTVGILITEGMPNGWLGFALAMAVSALLALIIGAISLRTKGVYFIMITLAFAQMLFYLAVTRA
jgi:branched-chain amino acid transport system permease protein